MPTLRSGDIVVMENLSGHKNKAERNAIRAVGAKLLYLSPLSPNLDPIEQALSKLKTSLRKENARTIERIEQCIARIIQQIEPPEWLSYFQQAGYAAT